MFIAAGNSRLQPVAEEPPKLYRIAAVTLRLVTEGTPG